MLWVCPVALWGTESSCGERVCCWVVILGAVPILSSHAVTGQSLCAADKATSPCSAAVTFPSSFHFLAGMLRVNSIRVMPPSTSVGILGELT